MDRKNARRNILKSGLAAASVMAVNHLSVADQHGQHENNSNEDILLEKAFAEDRYVLPPLPYDYDALEPHYQGQALEIHHKRHHQAYVTGLNAVLEKMDNARRDGNYDPSHVRAYSSDLAFNGSGHELHSIFWHSMTAGGVEMPDSFARQVRRDFGSVERFKAHFSQANKAIVGGWGVLAYEPIGQRLIILQVMEHQDNTFTGAVPLLVCDMWEHAFYLQYKNDRSQWVDNFMEIANWQYAAKRYDAIRR